MKTTKKILSFVLALLLVVTIAPVGSFEFKASAENELAETGQCGANVYWNFDSDTGELVISGTGPMWDYYYSSPFYNSNLKTVIIENGVTKIGYATFNGCDNLTSAIIGDSVTTIGRDAFSKSGLQSVTLGKNVTEISSHAFYACSNLIEIILPEALTTIGSAAFSHCENLTTIKIPSAVETIESSAFDGCYNLNEIVVDKNNSYYVSDEYGVLFDKNKTTLIKYPTANTRNSYIMPDSVIKISSSAFSNCKNLTDITLSDNLSIIERFAFNECKNLSITFPDKVTIIDMYAFYNCDNLKSIIFPDSISTIGYKAFADCSSLYEIVLPNHKITIDGYAFEYTAFYNDSSKFENGMLYIGKHLIGANYLIGGLRKIKDGTLSISNHAFGGHDYIRSIVLPDSITTIGESTFSFCDNLKSITIPKSVTEIKDSAFDYCLNLTHVFYEGSEEDWNSIKIESNNNALINANIHYNSIVSGCYDDCEFTNKNNSDAYLKNEATCSTKAVYYYSCAICGKTSKGTEFEKTFEAGSITGTHNYQSTITPPTCEKDGYTTFTCTVCGSYYLDKAIEKFGHKFVDYYSDKNATCISDGTKTAVCANGCGKKNTIVDEGSKLEHDYDSTFKCTMCGVAFELSAVKNLTLEYENNTVRLSWSKVTGASGYEIYATSSEQHDWLRISCSLSTFYTIKDNTFSKFKVRAYKEIDGNKFYGNFSDPVLLNSECAEHDYKSITHISPTCVYEGYHVYACAKCGIEYRETLPALGHEYEYTPDGNATCTQDGTRTGKCIRCPKTISDYDPGSALGHSFTLYISNSNATCTDNATEWAACNRGCGAKDIRETPNSALGHEFEGNLCTRCHAVKDDDSSDCKHIYPDSWNVIITPDCQNKGAQVKVCTLCKNIISESLPKTGHIDHNGDSKCDSCDKKIVIVEPQKPEEKPCSCDCHAGGIKAFFFKLINFFAKIFDKNARVCDCGKAH